MTQKITVNSLAIARTKAAEDKPYLASALWSLVPVEKKGIKTMGVDAYWRLYYDPELDWSPEILSGVLQHEVWHLLRDHHDRSKGLDPRAANIANDMEINDDLREEKVKLPDFACYPEMIGAPEGLLGEQYYDLLPKSKQGGKIEDPKGGSASGNVPNEYEEGEPDGDKEGTAGVSGAEADLIKHKVAVDIKEQHAKGIGNVAAGVARWAKEILQPKVDWQKELKSRLRRAVEEVRGQHDFSYGRLAKKQVLYPEVMLPSLVDPVVKPAVVVDTSGSMGDEELRACLGEVEGCIRAVGYSDIPVVSCDMEAHVQNKVTSAKRVRLKGGGGTDMGVGIEAASKLKPRPNVIVVLTDGYTPWPPKPPRGTELIVGIVRPKGSEFKDAGVPEYAKQVNIEVGS